MRMSVMLRPAHRRKAAKRAYNRQWQISYEAYAARNSASSASFSASCAQAKRNLKILIGVICCCWRWKSAYCRNDHAGAARAPVMLRPIFELISKMAATPSNQPAREAAGHAAGSASANGAAALTFERIAPIHGMASASKFIA